MHWQTCRFRIDLSRPRVMGIVNVTPDSFSDGGSHDDTRTAIAHCERLLAEGADILDIGGESTRPGAPRVDADVEWERIADVLAAALQLGVPVSVGTFETSSRIPDKLLDFGLGLQVSSGSGLEFTGEYQAQAGKDYLSHTGSARISWRF